MLMLMSDLTNEVGDHDDELQYRVVINHEEQYSIWPEERPRPLGWNDTEKSGSKSDCLEYIRREWTDMRPRSLRLQMDSSTELPPS